MRKPGYIPSMRALKRAAARNRAGTRHEARLNYAGRHHTKDQPRLSLLASALGSLRTLARALMALKRSKAPVMPIPAVEPLDALTAPTVRAKHLAGRHRAPRTVKVRHAGAAASVAREAAPARLPRRLRRELQFLAWCERQGQHTIARHVHPDDARGKRALPKWSFA